MLAVPESLSQAFEARSVVDTVSRFLMQAKNEDQKVGRI